MKLVEVDAASEANITNKQRLGNLSDIEAYERTRKYTVKQASFSQYSG